MIMKRQNRFCIVITTIILLFLVSCVDREGKYIFYQFKNETGEDLKLKFYYKIKATSPAYDSLMIRTGEYSTIFWEVIGGYNAPDFRAKDVKLHTSTCKQQLYSVICKMVR